MSQFFLWRCEENLAVLSEGQLTLREVKPDGFVIFFAFRKKAKKMVAGPGIEPGTRGFSVPCSTYWAIPPLSWFSLLAVLIIYPVFLKLQIFFAFFLLFSLFSVFSQENISAAVGSLLYNGSGWVLERDVSIFAFFYFSTVEIFFPGAIIIW